MRIIKKYSLLLCILLLTGCAMTDSKNSAVQDWIPKETPVPSLNDTMEEKTDTVSTKETPDNGTGEKSYSLTKNIKAEDQIFCSLSELQQAIGEEAATDISKLHMNTYFIDENGLLCISIDTTFDFPKNQCTLQKKYYLTDKTVFTEEESFDITEKWREENNTFYVELSFLSQMFSWNYQIDENNKVVIQDENITFEKHESVVYEPLVFDVVAGSYWSVSGKMMEAILAGEDYRIHFSCTKPESYVEVKEGEQLRFNFFCSWIPEVASILFLDDNDKVIQVYAYTTSNTFEDYILTVPAGATKMHLSFFKNQEYRIERVQYVIGNDLEQLDAQWYEEQCEAKLKENQKLSWQHTSKKPLDKAYITFVLDDCRPDMDLVADLFEEYQIPLCIAAITEHFYYPGSKGEETRLEVCHRVVENGGEILAHDGEALTQELLDDFPTKYKHFYKDKKYLEAYGFDVQGIILAGGEGQVVGSSKSDAWIRTHFNYSDLYGVEEMGEPYYHKRYWLLNYKDNYQEIIQEAIENKQWVSFFFHEFAEVEEGKMREILQYVSELPQEQVEKTNYRTIYEKFYQNEDER